MSDLGLGGFGLHTQEALDSGKDASFAGSGLLCVTITIVAILLRTTVRDIGKSAAGLNIGTWSGWDRSVD